MYEDSKTQLSARGPRSSEEFDILCDQLAKIESAFRSLNYRTQSAGSLPPEKALEILISIQKLRHELYFHDLFADPAWDMLLTLKIYELRQHRLAITGLCAKSYVPNTTALRWIKIMEQRGLMERSNDSSDGRRKYLRLSDSASSALDQFLINLSQKISSLL
jgi:DNA-binding MarR family transcriptional regulator